MLSASGAYYQLRAHFKKSLRHFEFCKLVERVDKEFTYKYKTFLNTRFGKYYNILNYFDSFEIKKGYIKQPHYTIHATLFAHKRHNS